MPSASACRPPRRWRSQLWKSFFLVEDSISFFDWLSQLYSRPSQWLSKLYSLQIYESPPYSSKIGSKPGISWVPHPGLPVAVPPLLRTATHSIQSLQLHGPAGQHAVIGQWAKSSAGFAESSAGADSQMFLYARLYMLLWFCKLYFYVLDCPGRFIPNLGQSVHESVSATLEFWHKEWLLRLETLQTFDQHDVWTKRQID